MIKPGEIVSKERWQKVWVSRPLSFCARKYLGSLVYRFFGSQMARTFQGTSHHVNRGPYASIGLAESYCTATATATDGMPFATTSTVLSPVSMPLGTVKRVDTTLALVATPMLKPNVRA